MDLERDGKDEKVFEEEEDHDAPIHDSRHGRHHGGKLDRIEDMPFRYLCQKLDRIMRKKRKEKDDILFDLWVQTKGPQNLYPLMRLLLPQLDSDRATYGLRESSIADMYIKAMGIAKTSEDALRLKNYKNPRSAGAKTQTAAGDFTTILYDVLKTRALVSEANSTATIGEVNQLLDDISQAPDNEARKHLFTKIMNTLSAKEQFWFARVILKDLKMGVRHESMLKIFHPRAMDIYNTTSSLAKVCELVADPDKMAQEMSQVAVFQPMKPMLCDKVPWKNLLKKLGSDPFVVEDKFDGERILVHKQGDEVKLFTRNSVDYTSRYSYGAKFSPVVLQAVKAQSCILDGEIVTWNLETQAYEPFGSNRSTALAENAAGRTQLCYKCFDVLFVDGRSVLDLPLARRRELLQSIIIPLPHLFEVVQQTRGIGTTMELMARLDDALTRGMEGVIVKNLTSPYLLGDRSTRWIKVKPDYIEGISDPLDVLILGGYYGEGTRRAGDISHFLLGVAEKTRDGGPPENFYAFCKVGSGYSMEELKELRARLSPHWRPYDVKRQPRHFMGWKHEKSDQPDVWIKPSESVVLELKCYEIVPCRKNKFHAEFTTRFPRVARVRLDKNWDECMTIEEIRALHARPAGTAGRARRVAEEHGFGASLARPATAAGTGGLSAGDWSVDAAGDLDKDSRDARFRARGPEDGEAMGGPGGMGMGPENVFAGEVGEEGYGEFDASGKKKRKAKGPGKRQLLGLLNQFRAADVSSVAVKEHLFVTKEGKPKEFCVISDDNDHSKQEIETLITEYGGSFVQNPSRVTTQLCICGKITYKVKLLRDSQMFDIVHYQWLLDSIAAHKEVPFLKKFVLSVRPELQSEIAKEVDPYGDLFAIPATRESLREVFNEVRKQHPHPYEAASLAASASSSSSSSSAPSSSASSSVPPAITSPSKPKTKSKTKAAAKSPIPRRGLSRGGLVIEPDSADSEGLGISDSASVAEDARTAPSKPMIPAGYNGLFYQFQDEEQEALASKYTVFRSLLVYLDYYFDLGDKSSLLADSRLHIIGAAIKLYGGKISETLGPNVTHVVFNDLPGPEGGIMRLDAILQHYRTIRSRDDSVRAKHMVTVKWVMDCIRYQDILDEKPYAPRARVASPAPTASQPPTSSSSSTSRVAATSSKGKRTFTQASSS